jgi:hypothetical protein
MDEEDSFSHLTGGMSGKVFLYAYFDHSSQTQCIKILRNHDRHRKGVMALTTTYKKKGFDGQMTEQSVVIGARIEPFIKSALQIFTIK